MNVNQDVDYLDILKKGAGYFTFRLTPNDLSEIQKLVSNHWFSVIKNNCPESAHEFENMSIDDYHTKDNFVNHQELWSKKARILPIENTHSIKGLSFFRQLQETFGAIQISNEDELYEEEVYWRLVRPNKGDIGPLHADKWFWDLGHGKMPKGKGRIKLWMSLFCEGSNGLRVVPKSHLTDYPYQSVDKHGMKKPEFNEDQWDLDIVKLNCNPGTVVVFNDNLLHGGCLNLGSKSRVSMEFTMLVNNELLV